MSTPAPNRPGAYTGEVLVKYRGSTTGRREPVYWRWNGSSWTFATGPDVQVYQRQLQQQQSQNNDEPGTPSGALIYPEELSVAQNTDYLKFTFHRYKQGGQITNYDDYNEETSFVAADGLPSYILLNMPQEVQSEIGAEWGGKSFSLIGKDIIAGAGNLVAGDLSGTFQSIGSLISKTTSGEAAQAGAAAAAVAAINQIPGVGGNLTINDLVQGGSSKILNPNVELMYESPTLRNLSLRMKLVARTAGEAETLQTIGRAFRKAAVPASADSNNRFIKIPPFVKVRFMRGSADNKDLPKYKMCAIKGASVNYAPDGQYVSFMRGYLPALELQLELQETKIIFSDDIKLSKDEASF